MAAARSMNPFQVLLRHRNFRQFWVGQTTSLIGSWMQSTAQAWLALELTGDPFWVTLVYASSSLPVAVISLFAGVIVDRYDKLRLVTGAQALLLVQALLLWWFTYTGSVTIGWLIALALIGGAINAVEIPARQTLMIELVGRDDLLDAIALNSGGFNLARIIGPTAAGILIATAGIEACFAVNAASYLAVLVGLARVRLPERASPAVQHSPVARLREGLSFVRRHREVWIIIRIIAVYAIFGTPYLALLPVIARDTLQGDAAAYGWLLCSIGLGALAAALALAAMSVQVRRGRLLAYAAHAFSVCLILFSLSRSFGLSVVLLLAVGFSMIVTNAVANGLLQTLAPDALRGRVMAAYAWVFVGIGPVIGPFLAGALAREIGAPATVGVGAAVTLAYGVWALARHPEIGAL
ncbi:MAG: MFS transporter [Gemmatimonadaceae bacterium]